MVISVALLGRSAALLLCRDLELCAYLQPFEVQGENNRCITVLHDIVYDNDVENRGKLW